MNNEIKEKEYKEKKEGRSGLIGLISSLSVVPAAFVSYYFFPDEKSSSFWICTVSLTFIFGLIIWFLISRILPEPKEPNNKERKIK